MKDRSRREENKEEYSEGSPLGKLSGAYSQENRGQFFFKVHQSAPFPQMPSILHASLSPHLRPHLQSAVSRNPAPSTSPSSSSSSGSLGFSSGLGFWSSSFGSLFLGLFLNHLGFSLIFRVSLYASSSFNPFPPQFCVPPVLCFYCFFILIMCIFPYLFVIVILILCPNLPI